ncbi:recombinase family protein [Neobacillus drentensis]|uniref:recombinase family protein n=1 Tax=Neobacillus drentensis TaxID=220684 RepID=UPI002FFF5679
MNTICLARGMGYLTIFAYYRNSIKTEIQKMSIDNQVSKVKELAFRKRLILKDENQYFDKETSARKTKTEQRNGMSRLLTEIKKGNVKTLLVYSRCRIARNVQQHMEIYQILRNHNVEVHFALENEVPMMFSPEGELLERILASFNQQNGEDIVTKLKDSKVTVARDGKHAAARINFGYRPDPKNKGDWIKHENEGVTVEKLYDLFLNESFKNINRFTNLVNKKGLRFKDGKEWSHGNVKNVLTNRIYKGERHYRNGDEPIINFDPKLVIVDESIWELVQIKMQNYESQRPMKSDEEGERKPSFLLENLIYCTECGEKLTYKNAVRQGQKLWVYQCPNHPKKKIRKEDLENKVIYYANQFFNVILKKDYENVVKKILEFNIKHYEKVEKFFESASQNFKSRIGSFIDELLVVDDYGKLPDHFIKNHEKIEELSKSTLKFKDYYYHSVEVMEELLKFHENHHSEQNLLEQSLDDESKIELLGDVVQGVYCGMENKIEIIFKHPYLVELTGGHAFELA